MASKSPSSRDEFTKDVKQLIAKRAAFRCSNPECRRYTLIPEISSEQHISFIGVAAHISAAAPNGPRYNPALTREQRIAPENGIHLCRICAERVDNHQGHEYPESRLKEWKIRHESWLRKQQEVDNYRRRNDNKLIGPYFVDNIIYDFNPEERSSGYIIIPEANSQIPSRITNVIGRIDKRVENSTYWIAVSPQGSFESWWPQKECKLDTDNFWKLDGIVLGRDYPEGEGDIGRQFEVALYEVIESGKW